MSGARDKAIDSIPGWKLPSLAEFMADFIDRYGRQVEDHYRFSQEVGRLIGAAQAQAVEPLQKVLLESMNRAPFSMTFREAELSGNRSIPAELWRGKFRGIWFRVVMLDGWLKLQSSDNASLGESEETWQTEWSS